jgi:transcriptional antiterminator RfaH
MTDRWYALHSKANKEEIVWQQLRVQNIETFYPCLRAQAVNPRAKEIKPYFPGYMFVRADLELAGLPFFQYLPHTNGLVCFGGEPAPVPATLIDALRQRVIELALATDEVCEKLKAGDLVSIQNGPFAGYEAVFDAHLSGGERVRVLLEFLGGRAIPVNLSAALLEQKTYV